MEKCKLSEITVNFEIDLIIPVKRIWMKWGRKIR
jgi:hypothetical protein